MPWLVVHNEVSEDATMAGADTILAAPDKMEEETEEDLAAFAEEHDEDRLPYLVIPDSRGTVRVLHMLRRWPY